MLELPAADASEVHGLTQQLQRSVRSTQHGIAAGQVVGRRRKAEVQFPRFTKGRERFVEAARVVQRVTEIEPAAAARGMILDQLLVALDRGGPAIRGVV